MLPTYILNKKFLQVFAGFMFCASSIFSIYLSNSLSKNSEYQKFLNAQASYKILINQELGNIEDQISFLASKEDKFAEINAIDFPKKNIVLIYSRIQKEMNSEDKIIWNKNIEEDPYLSQIFINSSNALIEASKKFLGKPLYGSVVNFPKSKNLPIVLTFKTEQNTFETIVIWLQVQLFIDDINYEYRKNFNLPLIVEISDIKSDASGFFVNKMPNLNLVIQNIENENYLNFIGLKIYYNTIIVTILNIIIAALLLIFISQTFTRFSIDNFKYLSFWNQEIKDKLLSVREISSSIAHELNQPLAAAEIYVSTLKIEILKENTEKSELIKISNNVVQQIARCSNIIKSMNTLSKNTFSEINSYNLNSLFADLMPLVLMQAEDYDSNVNIDIDNKIFISVDKIAFEQIVLNISRNAFQAMYKKENQNNVLNISASFATTPKNLFRENKVSVTFSDNGFGIPKEIENKIFESFFSNKKDGAGLGLNIVKSLIEQNKGRVSFSNNSRGGADFIIDLPMSNKEEARGDDNFN